jgi:very-short-patch-repair endonuclease
MNWDDVTRRQAGLITRHQLGMCGISAAMVDGWLRSGRLDRTTTDGLYRLGGAPSTAGETAWFAVLSTRSPLSFVSGARWWDMPVADDGLVHITRFGRRRLDWPDGVRVHRVAIDRRSITRHRGLWVTTPAETVLDCMGWLPLPPARTLADRALQQGWCDLDDVRRRLEESPGRWGNRQLRRLLRHLGDQAHAESERKLHRLLRSAGLTGWVPQFPFVAGGRRFAIDVAFPELRLAIEIDGYAYHSSDDRFQRDRTKQNALIAAGWRVLRFTWADLDERPSYVIGQILQLLAA